MNFNEYHAEALSILESSGPTNSALIQAGIGLSILVGEINADVHIHAIQGRPLTVEMRENLINKMGNVLWFLAYTCDTLGVTMNHVAKQNLISTKEKYHQEKARENAINEANVSEVAKQDPGQET